MSKDETRKIMTEEDIIDELKIQRIKILQDFDFKLAEAIFRVLGQTYYGGEYPTEDTLRNIADSLMSSAIQEYNRTKKPTRVSSGRMVAYIHCWDSSIELELVCNPIGIYKSVIL